MIEHLDGKVLSDLVAPFGVAVVTFFLRKITSSLKSVAEDFHKLRELPQKMEETTQRIERKYDQRFNEMEKIREAQDRKIDLLIDSLTIKKDPG